MAHHFKLRFHPLSPGHFSNASRGGMTVLHSAAFSAEPYSSPVRPSLAIKSLRSRPRRPKRNRRWPPGHTGDDPAVLMAALHSCVLRHVAGVPTAVAGLSFDRRRRLRAKS